MDTITTKLLRLQIGLYSMAEAARLLLLHYSSLTEAIRVNHIPKPTHTMPNGGKRKFYDRDDIKTIKAYFLEARKGERKSLLSIRGLATELNVSYQRLQKYVREKRVPAPTRLFKYRRYYHVDEVPAMRKAWAAVTAKTGNKWAKIKASGYYTGRDACKMLNPPMPYITFQTWQNCGKFPKPSKRCGDMLSLVYDMDDIKEMQRLQRHHGYKPLKARGGNCT